MSIAEYPEIIHHGAVEGVTGSCHELRLSPESSVLVDCGLFQGAEKSRDGSDAERLAVEFPVDRVRALLDMGRSDADGWMITTGQSGHPASPHYDDLILRHRDVDDLPMRLNTEPPEGDLLVLRPGRDTAAASRP